MRLFGKKKKNSSSIPQTTDAKTKKKKSSPLKKITKLFKSTRSPNKKSKKNKRSLSPRGKRKPSKLTLVSPQIGGEINNFYSNDTDGFEVILDGEQLQYEENLNNRGSPEKVTDIDDLRTCGAGEVCSPLSDWNKFVSLLVAPNLDDIQKFVFGASDSRGASYALADSPSPQKLTAPRGAGAQRGRSRAAMMQNNNDSLPFDEGTPEVQLDGNSSIQQQRDDDDDQQQQQQQETVEIRHFSTVATSNVPSPAPQRPVGSGGPLTPPKLTDPHSRSTHAIGTMYRKNNLPDEEVYDTEFTLQFLKEVSNIGVIMTYFKVPNDDQEIVSQVVSLRIQPGLARGSRLLEPKLSWTSIHDMDPNGSNGTSISLLGIHSIHTSLGGNDDDETPFFTITTETGEVHAFESPTLAERNYIVHGIKNVVAWLSYHLVMGNMATGTELVSDLDEERGEISGELPSLKTPVQAMNELSHHFLD